ncbi:MAG TPA: TylF/MycF/NovP-related O-methyltransferase [bacterium]|jgi:O-methyltransferase|nr:TylF/MycF/NovP-related O-methyltransferase [bacterium]
MGRLKSVETMAAKVRPALMRLYGALPFGSSRKMRVIVTVKPYTMMSYAKLSALYDLAWSLERHGVPGSFVQCGVLNGGSAGLIASTARDNILRHLWLFDSWEGLPDPSEFDVARSGQPGRKGMFHGSLERVKEVLFERLGAPGERVHLEKGWFAETVPQAKPSIGEIALLNLDCSLYESYKLCLEELYDAVVSDGIVWIDDYAVWEGCKRAVDEFLESKKLSVNLQRVREVAQRYDAVWFRKPPK